MNSKVLIFIVTRLIALVLAGVIIHLLQSRDFIMMLVLAVITVLVYFRKRKSKSVKLFFLGFTLSAIGGVLAENWGISNGLWEYHDLPDGRTFPYWLPFAWGHAFTFLYSFEAFFIREFKINTLGGKVLLTILCSMILPVIGEIVTVYLDVWTYYGDFKILGIPLYAIGLLALFHTGIYFVLYALNLYWKQPDPVFAIQNSKLKKENLF